MNYQPVQNPGMPQPPNPADMIPPPANHLVGPHYQPDLPPAQPQPQAQPQQNPDVLGLIMKLIQNVSPTANLPNSFNQMQQSQTSRGGSQGDFGKSLLQGLQDTGDLAKTAIPPALELSAYLSPTAMMGKAGIEPQAVADKLATEGRVSPEEAKSLFSDPGVSDALNKSMNESPAIKNMAQKSIDSGNIRGILTVISHNMDKATKNMIGDLNRADAVSAGRSLTSSGDLAPTIAKIASYPLDDLSQAAAGRMRDLAQQMIQLVEASK